MKKLWNGNKTLQRLLALFLCVCLFATLIPMGAFAVETDPSVPPEATGESTDSSGPAYLDEGWSEEPGPGDGSDSQDEESSGSDAPEEISNTVAASGAGFNAVATYDSTAFEASDEKTAPGFTVTEMDDFGAAEYKALIPAGENQEIKESYFFTLSFEIPGTVAITPTVETGVVYRFVNNVPELVTAPVEYVTDAVYGVVVLGEKEVPGDPPVTDEPGEGDSSAPPAPNGPEAEPPAAPGATWTVSFSVGAAAADGVTVADVIVADGETITLPDDPVWLVDNVEIKEFEGWYTDEACTESYQVSPVHSSFTLYANWADTEGMYYINFYNQAGTVVYRTRGVAENSTVASAKAPQVGGKVFIGWSEQMQGEQDPSALTAFDFSTVISEYLQGGNVLNLYAWYDDAVQVQFKANGGTAVPTELIRKGGTLAEPATSRTGYTFAGWYTDEACSDGNEFDFATAINEDLILYAKWNSKLVGVKVVYMFENADDDDYSPADVTSSQFYAYAGTQVSVTKTAPITNIGARHNVTGAYRNDDGTGQATIPDIQNQYFQFDHASAKTVAPDGSTVILAYYKRARVTVKFSFTDTQKNYGVDASIEDWETKIPQDVRDKYDAKYDEVVTGRHTTFEYSFTAKYGQDITKVYPQKAWIKSTNGPYDGNYGSTNYGPFYGWDVEGSNTAQVSNMFTMESNLFGGAEFKDNVLFFTGDEKAMYNGTHTFWLIYARTSLPGENVDFTYDQNRDNQISDDEKYTIYREACQQSSANATSFGYKDLNGCTPVTPHDDNQNGPRWVSEYSDLRTSQTMTVDMSDRDRTITAIDANGSKTTIASKFNDISGGKATGNDRCQVLLYNRSKITLTLDFNYDGAPADVTKQYWSGEKIYDDPQDILLINSAPIREGYIFGGWYTTSDGTDGTQFEPNSDSTITGTTTLYAKWDPDTYRAEFYLYDEEGAEPYRVEGFGENDYLTEWEVNNPSFLGWDWKVDGVLVPFDFGSAVGGEFCTDVGPDGKGVLKLYARWDGANGYVSFNPGIAGTDEQIVTWNTRYELNKAGVQLPNYNADTVWPSGVPNDTGYTFVGWLAPNGRIYQPGKNVTVTRHQMEFVAQWSKDAVKLIYDPNGGTPASRIVENWERDTTVSVWDNMDDDVPHYTRTDYEFVGWNTQPDGSGSTVNPGNIITLSADETILYAMWELKTAQITITKIVTGNIGDWNKTFDIKIDVADNSGAIVIKNNDGTTSDAQTVTISLKHAESTTITVKKGTKLVISEPGSGEYQMSLYSTWDNNDEEKRNLWKGDVVVNNDTSIWVRNHLNASIETGVVLDSLPYILILAAVALVGVLLVTKRKNRD